MAKQNTTREADLAAREAALAEREAQLRKEQAEFNAYKEAQAKGENPDPAAYGIRNAKERLYDKIPLTVKQLDIIIAALMALLVGVVLFGAVMSR